MTPVENIKNTYDKHDMVRRGSFMRAGPMKIAVYQVRDPETGDWSAKQYHMTFDNTVMAVMGQDAAKLFANFVQRDLTGDHESSVEKFEVRIEP